MFEYLIQIVIALLAAIVYAVLGYLKSATEEELDWYKLARTIILGLLIGLGLVIAGIPVTQETVLAEFVALAGLYVLIENALKAIWRWLGIELEPKPG